MRIFCLVFILFLSLDLYSQNTVRNDVDAVLKRVIPRFKAKGDLQEVFNALREETIRADPDVPILSLVYFPPYEDDGLALGHEVENLGVDRKVSVDFENLTVREIINNLCIGYNLRYKKEQNTVVILHPNEETENLKTRFIKLSLSDLKKFNDDGAQKFLESQGVVFNPHCFAKYLSSVNAAIKNIESELKKAEECFEKFKINGLLQELKNTLNNKSPEQRILLKQIKQIDDWLHDDLDKGLKLEEKEVRLNKKLNIIIPKVRFVNRKLDWIVDMLKRTSRDLDEEGEGINILLKADLVNAVKPVNLDLNDATIQDILRFICRKLDLSYKVEERTIIIGRQLKGTDIVKAYDTSASFLKYVKADHKNNFKKALLYLGVKFKPGSSIDYIKNIQRIVISNSVLEHRKLHDIFQFFNK